MTLVVLGSATPDESPVVDAKLLAALPPAKRVLEIGHAGSTLGAAYRRTHAQAQWTLFDGQGAVDALYDLVVVSDGLQHLADPRPLLDDLAVLSAPDATLVASVPNHAQLAALERIVEGDFDQPQQLSPATLYKRLLDAGWMPTLADHHAAAPGREAVLAAAHAMAEALSVPRRTAERTLGLGRLVVQAKKMFDAAPPAGRARFAVVVPTTRETQLRLNVERSPGLAEVDARIVSYRGASDPAQALERSLANVDADWVLFCHQDVYFPCGFGARLNSVLDGVPAAQRAHTLIGFAGMGVDRATLQPRPAGFVIDRLSRFDHPESDAVLSIDELAIVVARESVHRIDPALGWHLWATDLCLRAVCDHQVFPRIVRLPLFHNSLNDHVLPPAFHASAQVLAAKHAGFGPIHTLCGVIGDARQAA